MMVCVCGALIPENAEQYPINRRTRSGRMVDDAIVKCVDPFMRHPESSFFNLVSKATVSGKRRETNQKKRSGSISPAHV